MTKLKLGLFYFVTIALGTLVFSVLETVAAPYQVTNLVSDLDGQGVIPPDGFLSNPWGLAFGPNTPFWVANNGSGTSTVYSGSTAANFQKTTTQVTIGNNAPVTGAVFNGTSDFNGDRFLFAAEDGSISGWRTTLGSTAETPVTASTNVYKGLAFGNNGSGNFLYASNIHTGAVDVYNSTFTKTTLPGSFTDANVPSGYAPFNIQNIGNFLYVTYALQDSTKTGDVAGPGNGYVAKFDLNGNLVAHLVSGGQLNSPWGLAVAPAGFGPLANALLVGNFGDGKINAYNPSTGAFLGTMQDSTGNPVFIDGLWALEFGNGTSAGSPNSLYFTAGTDGELHGTFGAISVPEPVNAALPLFVIALLLRRKTALPATVQV